LRIVLGEDRIAEIRRYLDATIEEFQTLVEKAGGFDDNRIGNGWRPAAIKETLVTVTPTPPSKILEKLQSLRWRALGMALRNFPKARTLKIEFEKPNLRYRPYWIAKAYHECFFFRGASYKVRTGDDVVAVEVDGKLRNLILRDTKGSSLLEEFKKRLERATGLISPGPRFFVLDGVTELARKYKEASLYLDAHGRYSRQIERFIRRNPPLRPISSVDQLKEESESAEVMPLHESKESVLRRLTEAVVEPPKTFTRILSNRFEVTALVLLYLPVYEVQYEYAKKQGIAYVNGLTAELLS
jgi:hypothetical protein